MEMWLKSNFEVGRLLFFLEICYSSWPFRFEIFFYRGTSWKVKLSSNERKLGRYANVLDETFRDSLEKLHFHCRTFEIKGVIVKDEDKKKRNWGRHWKACRQNHNSTKNRLTITINTSVFAWIILLRKESEYIENCVLPENLGGSVQSSAWNS